jgi:hypothetical protein
MGLNPSCGVRQLDFKLEVLNSNGSSVEKLCISLKLFVTNSSKKYVNENTLPIYIVLLFTSTRKYFPKKFLESLNKTK